MTYFFSSINRYTKETTVLPQWPLFILLEFVCLTVVHMQRVKKCCVTLRCQSAGAVQLFVGHSWNHIYSLIMRLLRHSLNKSSAWPKPCAMHVSKLICGIIIKRLLVVIVFVSTATIFVVTSNSYDCCGIQHLGATTTSIKGISLNLIPVLF